MSVSVAWQTQEKTSLRYTFKDNWDWQDMFDALMIGRDMMTEVGHPIHILCDLSQTTRIPTSSIRRLRDIADTRPNNTGFVFIISDHYLMQAFYTTFVRINPDLSKQYRLASSIEAAIETIETTAVTLRS